MLTLSHEGAKILYITINDGTKNEGDGCTEFS